MTWHERVARKLGPTIIVAGFCAIIYFNLHA